MKSKIALILVLLLLTITSCGKKTYTIKFEVDGEIVKELNYENTQEVEFFIPEKEGFKFDGWMLGGIIRDSYKAVKEDITFKAVFTKIDYIQNAIDKLNIPSITISDIELPTMIDGVKISWFSSKSSSISNTGKVNRKIEDATVTLSATFTYLDESRRERYVVIVPAKDPTIVLQDLLDNYQLDPIFNNGKLDLKSSFEVEGEVLDATWTSSNSNIISNSGELVFVPNVDTIVTLTVSLSLKDVVCEKSFEILVKADPAEKILNEAYYDLKLPVETNEDLSLPSTIGKVSIIWTTSNSQVITKDGKITRHDVDKSVVLKAQLTYKDISRTKAFNVKVSRLDTKDNLTNLINKVKIDQTFVDGKIFLPSYVQSESFKVDAAWTSSKQDILSNDGEIVAIPSVDTSVILTLTLTKDGVSVSKEFTVIVKTMSSNDMLIAAFNSIKLPTIINNDFILPLDFIYDVKGVWKTNDALIITHEGVIKAINKTSKATISVTLSIDDASSGKTVTMEKEFKINVNKSEALIVERASQFNKNNMTNVSLVDNKLVLTPGSTYGIYESDEISTRGFDSLVGSFSAITNKTATVELLVNVKVGSSYNGYISYCPGGWGLGLQNSSRNVTQGKTKISTDEIIVTSGTGTAIKFKLILRRNSASVASPEVSLAAFALDIPGFTGVSVDKAGLPNKVLYDVPKHYQGAVPGIGGSICSATSSTMLLNFKGFSFADKDEYEHRYIAGLVRDYGAGIYGNWSYNATGIGAYGLDAYVERLYSIDELLYHLANVGPCAISVRGQMTSDQKSYHTNGHLLLMVGYEYVNGNLKLISNDPNVPSVRCVYAEQVIKDTWRGIVYTVE